MPCRESFQGRRSIAAGCRASIMEVHLQVLKVSTSPAAQELPILRHGKEKRCANSSKTCCGTKHLILLKSFLSLLRRDKEGVNSESGTKSWDRSGSDAAGGGYLLIITEHLQGHFLLNNPSADVKRVVAGWAGGFVIFYPAETPAAAPGRRLFGDPIPFQRPPPPRPEGMQRPDVQRATLFPFSSSALQEHRGGGP